MAHALKALGPAKAERLRRKAEQTRREKRKFILQISVIGVLMVGAVAADYLFIQWGRRVRHQQQYHRQSVTNSVAGTNRPAGHPARTRFPPAALSMVSATRADKAPTAITPITAAIFMFWSFLFYSPPAAGLQRTRGFQTLEGFVTSAVERFGNRGVEPSMDRVRTSLCSLLSALWVLAAGHCLAGPVSGCPDECGRTAISAAGHGGHAPVTDVRSFEQSARLLNRRVGPQVGWSLVPVTVAISTSGFEGLYHASAPLTISTEALGLAKCWQFYWRTASEPRAPSSVS